MLRELIKLANHLDSKGLTKEADILDGIISKASSENKIIFLLPKTDMKDFGYLYNLIISLATRIKGSVVQRVESLDSIFKDKYDLIEFFDKAGDSAPQKLSDMGFSVVSTETNKMPGRETYAIFFNLYSGGQKVKSSSTNLAGLKEGQRPDGTHASDGQIFEALKELLG